MRRAFDIVKAHYEANDRRDMDGMLADIAPDCRWTEMDGFPCAGTYVGPQEVFENVFQALGQAFEEYTFRLERLLDAGDEVVGVGEYSGTHRRTGKSFKARVVHVWSVSGDKIRRFEQFTDTLRVDEAMR
ncbi:nuclear transport factor 2 family protein [Rhizobium bangladeshense]|uniref:nuclear transport factor 2 family protein n=1 Tax=Rhizobium bangladeshense TaxID=1138189 RepID=UPI0007E57403|nr:nuclear transport factor 2 family protein [Rhizobium bangladeshense]